MMDMEPISTAHDVNLGHCLIHGIKKKNSNDVKPSVQILVGCIIQIIMTSKRGI